MQKLEAYVWKKTNGEEVPMLDLNPHTIKIKHKHCIDMLRNKDERKLGKCIVKTRIEQMIVNANATLFLRYLLYDAPQYGITTIPELLNKISLFRNKFGIIDLDNIGTIFPIIPISFESLIIKDVLDASLDRQLRFDKRILKDSFILKQRLWIDENSKKELMELDENGKIRNYMDVIKERLCLHPNLRLTINPSGLNYFEFRSLVKLKSGIKFNEIPSETLILLKDKILLELLMITDKQINVWASLASQLEEVASYKRIKLN